MINKLVRLSLAAAVIACATATAASAQTALNNRTKMTFTQPVEVPGKILPAGTYTFEMNDSPSNRHVVQIMDEAGTKVVALVLAIPSTRPKATEETIVTFNETAPGQPQAIRVWYYPGQTVGNELVYSNTRARELAAAANMPVQSTDDTAYVNSTVDSMKTAKVTPVEPQPKAQPLPPTPVQPEPVVAPPTPTPMPTPTPTPVDTATTPTRDELPRTAGTLPLVMFVGAGLLALGLVLRGLTAAKAKR